MRRNKAGFAIKDAETDLITMRQQLSAIEDECRELYLTMTSA